MELNLNVDISGVTLMLGSATIAVIALQHGVSNVWLNASLFIMFIAGALKIISWEKAKEEKKEDLASIAGSIIGGSILKYLKK